MSKKPKKRDLGFVFSTKFGELCAACDRPIAACACAEAAGPAKDGIVRVRRETKGRKGKGVTIVHGAPVDAAALKQLAKELKSKCATGGKIADGEIELQGDHRDRVVKLLSERGWNVKRVGG